MAGQAMHPLLPGVLFGAILVDSWKLPLHKASDELHKAPLFQSSLSAFSPSIHSPTNFPCPPNLSPTKRCPLFHFHWEIHVPFFQFSLLPRLSDPVYYSIIIPYFTVNIHLIVRVYHTFFLGLGYLIRDDFFF